MNHDFRADLHCHTTCSDGTDEPLEVLRLAKECGLRGLSITDHDTTAAYTPELFSKADQFNIQLLTGVEISADFRGTSVHILGYGFDLESKSLQKFLDLMQERREMRNREILEKLAQKKIVITEEELKDFGGQRSIGRPHIAQLLIQRGVVNSIRDAFEIFLKEGACCYASGTKYHPLDAIDAIHSANGKAVLAHPHFYKKREFLRKLLALPFDGYECHYAKIEKGLEAVWIQRAKERNLIATGGSDYHGTVKPHIPLGCSWVDQATFEKLFGN